jgi:LSD1 subclass zinc finger protein
MALFSLRNRTQFPIRCCKQIIPVNRISSALSTRTKRLYTSRVDEEAVPLAERLYCPQASCRQLIVRKYQKPGAKYQKCPRCRTLICSECRDLAHADRECVEDPGLAGVLEVARRNHWQRCFSCHAMVEKMEGCQHVKCLLCHTEFW